MIEENLILKNVTGGKNHRSSLVFHFVCDDQNHEFHIRTNFILGLLSIRRKIPISGLGYIHMEKLDSQTESFSFQKKCSIH